MAYNDAEIIRSGMSIVPDYAEQQQRQLLNDLTRLQIAGGQQDMQMAAAKQAAAVQRQQDYLGAVSAFGAKPTFEAYRDLQLRFPEQHQAISSLYQGQRDEHADRSAEMFGTIIGAARNGRWDLAAREAEKMVTAETDAGQADESDFETLRILKSGTPEERQQILGMMVHQFASSAGSKNTAEMWNALFDEDRDRELQPDRAREQTAKADIAEAEAETAPDYYGGRAREQVADADIAESDSAWREAKNATAAAKSSAQLTNIRSLIAKRAAALKKPLEEVTNGDMRRHYSRKRSKGARLTPAEREAEPIFAPKPKSVAKPGAVTTIVNPRTGERMILRDGRWVPL